MGVRRIAIMLLAVVLAATACSEPPTPVPSVGPALTLALPDEPLALLAFVALSEDLFAQNGIEVEHTLMECGATALESCLAGDYDLALVPEVPVALRLLDGSEPAIVATIASADDDSRVIARRSAGIETAHDLAGKRIGAVRLGQTHCYLGTLLESVGLSQDDVDMVFLTPAEGADALRVGDLDALAVRPPVLTQLEDELRDEAVVFEVTVPPRKNLLLVSRPEVLAERADDLVRVVSALVAAEEALSEDPARAQRVTLPAALDLSDADIAALLGSGRFEVRLDQSLVLRLEHRTRWLVDSGCVEDMHPGTPVPNVLEFLHPDVLRTVDPSRVSILGWSER